MRPPAGLAKCMYHNKPSVILIAFGGSLVQHHVLPRLSHSSVECSHQSVCGLPVLLENVGKGLSASLTIKHPIFDKHTQEGVSVLVQLWPSSPSSAA